MSAKKFMRFCIGLAIIAILSLLIAGLLVAQDTTVTRTLTIDAPVDSIAKRTLYFRQWPLWTAWSRLDSTMQNEFSGNDGSVGCTYKWIGDPKKTGTVLIKNSQCSAKRLDFSFELQEPSKAKSKGYIELTPNGSNTTVTFCFTNHIDYPWNAMAPLSNIDKMVGKDLENGLKNLEVLLKQPTN
jgi:hypothetical protein